MTVNTNKKKVLIISFYFPPNNAIGAVRIGKFAKYLPEFGWEPIVLTVNDIRGLTQTLPTEINETNVIRTPYFNLSGLFARRVSQKHNIPLSATKVQKGKKRSLELRLLDLGKPIYTLPVIEQIIFDPMGWYSYAVRAALEIIRNNEIKMIFSTFGPSVPHLIASRIHKKTNIPWVAEFRDPWSFNEYGRQTQPFIFFERQWEKQTLKNCDLLISVSELLAKKLEFLHSKKTIVIANGFDEDDYKEQVPITTKFTITYTGNVYTGKRDPSPLFQALKELHKKGIISPEDIEVRFFGQNINETIPALIEKYDIKAFVKIYGFVPFRESIKRQRESTILLILSWNDPRDSGTMTGKIYEYIGAGRPILAVAFKGGEIDSLLQKTGCGIVVNEVNEIKNILMKWLGDFKNNGKVITCYHPHTNIITNYSRKNQAQKLAQIFDELTLVIK